MTKNKNTPIADLLFNGIVYKVVGAPEKFYESSEDINTFFDIASDINLEDKLSAIKAADALVEQIKGRSGLYSAFTDFFQGISCGVIFFNNQYQIVFQNENALSWSEKVPLYRSEKTLNAKIVSKIGKTYTISELIQSKRHPVKLSLDKKTNIYLARSYNFPDKENSLNMILIPPDLDFQSQAYKKLVGELGLTKKESALTFELINGLSLKEISQNLNVSLHTLRSHLKSVFSKTNTNSQASLVRLFLDQEIKVINSFFNPNEIQIKKRGDNADLFFETSFGNKICFKDYGPKQGKPLIVLHSLLGSRFNIPYNQEEILEKHNRRVIIADRPGYGSSDPMPNYNEFWQDMFVELMSELKLDKVDLLGSIHSCAQALDTACQSPEKINRIILASPLIINTASQQKHLGEITRGCFEVTAFSKKLGKEIYKLWSKSMIFDPDSSVRKMVNENSGTAERELIKNNKFIERLTLNLTRSQQNNAAGSAEDAVYAVLPHNKDLTNIQIPFDIWIGDEDRCITVDGAKEICAPLPNKTFHVREGYGEDIYYHLFEEIIQ